MQIYEYLFTGVLIISILIASSIMVTTLSGPPISASQKDQLKITAEKIMTQILLDPGYPYNWGSDNTSSENLRIFGLAKYGETSRGAYILDPDKVSRLNSAIGSQWVNPSYAANLLNLGNDSARALGQDYGFTLEFNETMGITFVELSPDVYSIKITADYNQPIINAHVTAELYYVNESAKIAYKGPISNTTLYDGTCNLNFSSINPNTTQSAKALIVIADYYGAHMAKIYAEESNVTTAYLLGRSLIASTGNPYVVPNGADSLEVVLTKTDQGFMMQRFFVQNVGSPSNFTLNSLPEPSAIAVMAVTQEAHLLVAFRDFSAISYRSIPAVQSAAFAYSIERTVLISGSTYTATLYFWRMST